MTIPFMSLSVYDITVSRNQSRSYTRITPLERTALRVAEVEYKIKQCSSPLTSSGSIAMQWLRRAPVVKLVTFTVDEDEI